ncbi:MAG TPA: hypothetical protein VL286_06355 [Rhizomicrobium sp.]|nr:hypothetical protein [Rhizomicrobium sp.]
MQDRDADDYRALKRDMIVRALAQHGLESASVEAVVSVPPRSRRRATLKILKQSGQIRIGFHAVHSHDIVDMRECLVLTPALFELVQHLRACFARLSGEGESAELYTVQADNGFDLAVSWNRKTTPALIAEIAAFAPRLGLVRVTAGEDLIYQSAVPEVCFGKARVKLVPRAFLQPTRDGEAVLQARVLEITAKARNVVDLFSGCGTFSLPLAERAKVHAVDADGALLDALAAAARVTSGLKPVTTEKRDLFKRPLTPQDLNRFDALVLDPPRSGALAQAKMLAKSDLRRIAYVSCDAASFARDAKVLTDGGFRLAWVVGVDQFLWSAHVELAAAFIRD